MGSSVVPGWPSPTCSGGDLTIHTKRLSETGSSVRLTLSMVGAARAVANMCPIARRVAAPVGRAADRGALGSRSTAIAAAILAGRVPIPFWGYQRSPWGRSASQP
jgi:hypothetical protein